MSGTGSGYDLSATTYSPDGRVFQIEYAQKAVDNGGTALALCCKDGVVFANEKFLLSKMLVPGTNKRIFPVDRHATLAISGLVADAKQIVERAREECSQYKQVYSTPIPGPVLADRVAMFMHMYTLYWSVRPFGSTVLLGIYDEVEGPQLYGIDPSGTAIKFKGIAVGKGRQAGRTEVEKLLPVDASIPYVNLTCEEAKFYAAKIIQKCHDDKDKDYELEMAVLCDASGKSHKMISQEEVHQLQERAKKAIEEEEDAQMEQD
ncbi:proteasome subunit alpha type 3, NTN hydrolase fold, putative [Perkinsus marinus ATCC 50983]|uniref:Proteasome subunit alpha type n=1 Tax=Perkinsus marinus (strain ATCC 50983 / TXsc) TaxID=423536 RepID=C5K8L3_PERM5|nr:proteasome subunit alpha type 3, NTN hydrolase fold, putative [Perkinsus marinus ATCC 50983]EER19220.1 proteasome subunit alpha type 3, NTN hydrolase fold, putative [Perkinsus marinus ATCC 50983]|eukprot:XP_002787424.1 proteasome subunit alpha type 3, NTN hydrolase fold, putative [Perkinsus marinus ATCC 50983]